MPRDGLRRREVVVSASGQLRVGRGRCVDRQCP